ncbi:hypothetical protein [Methylomonas sp. LL1]|uniref:hypothetical protein n=1 Tax=Methylomonas sp. LL1 TaxID=2785785 RepID=UPI001E65C95F|nr:hypothetical protein [Methylomonas sp. LL1]
MLNDRHKKAAKVCGDFFAFGSNQVSTPGAGCASGQKNSSAVFACQENNHATPPSFSINARMSSTRQAVVRSDIFTGAGYVPSLTRFKNVVRPTGISGGIFFFLSPTIDHIRRKPVSGSLCVVVAMPLHPDDACYTWLHDDGISKNN